MIRDYGFYWVMMPNGTQEVALWDGQNWYAAGNDCLFEDGEVRVASCRLIAPSAATVARDVAADDAAAGSD